MDDNNNQLRAALYGLFSMAGMTDWAVDLQSYESDKYFDNPNGPDEPLAECDATYTDLDRLDADAEYIPGHCHDIYIMEALAETLRRALDEYDQIMRTDYDKYNSFAKVARKAWENNLDEFYHEYMDEYFTCYEQRQDGGELNRWRNETIPCPPKYSPGRAFSIYAVVKDQGRLARFLEEKYQIEYSWTQQKLWRFFPCNEQTPVDCNNYGLMHGGPELRPDFQVPNPKEAIASSLGNLRSPVGLFQDTAKDIRLDWADEPSEDIVDGATVPVFMVRTAVENMRQVYEAGDRVEKEEVKTIILLAISAFLFILPGLGSGMAAVTDVATLSRLALIAAEAGAASGTPKHQSECRESSESPSSLIPPRYFLPSLPS